MPRFAIYCAAARDALRLSPTIAWLVTSLRAIPAYGALGWTTPVVCAVFSSAIAIAATYDIYWYHTPNIHSLYTPILTEEGGSSAAAAAAVAPAPSRRLARFKLLAASASAFICLVFTVTFMVIAYGTIKPEQEDMPCDGECEGCIEDPDCSNWVALMEDDHPSVNICPPAKKSADTDVTFSCLADAYWMLCTTIIAGIWTGAAFAIFRRSPKTAEASVGGGGGDNDL